MSEIARAPVIARVGVDLAKQVIQVHAVDASGRRVVTRGLVLRPTPAGRSSRMQPFNKKRSTGDRVRQSVPELAAVPSVL